MPQGRFYTRGTLEERFWVKVDRRSDEECWPWLAGLRDRGHDAYGAIGVRGEDGKWRMRSAHVVAYELLVGPVPEGLEIDHRCHNIQCVNPRHLEAVTHAVNLTRRRRFVLAEAPSRQPLREARPDECIHGHDFTEANTHVRPDGSRTCRRCDRDRKTRGRAELQMAA